MQNLELIDWGMVGAASLWITALALLLSTLGFADYHARQEGLRLRDLLRRWSYQTAVNAGLMLFCLGLMASARSWVEMLLWGVLALAFAYYTIQSLRSRPDGGEE